LSLIDLLITTHTTSEIWTSESDDYRVMVRHNQDGKRSGLTKLIIIFYLVWENTSHH
jgi:hypothetical protein